MTASKNLIDYQTWPKLLATMIHTGKILCISHNWNETH